jgi:hypothetical protein
MGGWSMWFNNKFSSTTGYTGREQWLSYACDSCQDSGSAVEHMSNTYHFNQFYNSTRMTLTGNKGFDLCGDNNYTDQTLYAAYIYTTTEDVDVFSDKYGSFDGSSGVSCGTLANIPATCTIGTGYWATNQSCTDISTIVGDLSQYPSRSTISGTLYKCTAANTWTSYYTPYYYPHPMRNLKCDLNQDGTTDESDIELEVDYIFDCNVTLGDVNSSGGCPDINDLMLLNSIRLGRSSCPQ